MSRSRSYLSRRPFTSRFLKRTQHSSDEDDEDEDATTAAPQQEEAASNTENRKKKYYEPTVMNNGTVIRLRREVSTSDDEEDSKADISEEDLAGNAGGEEADAAEPESLEQASTRARWNLEQRQINFLSI